VNQAQQNVKQVPIKLFIGGISNQTTDDSLKIFYEQFGKVIGAHIIRNPINHCSRGFGFVTFASNEDAIRALLTLPHVIDGKEVEPKKADETAEHTRMKNKNPTKKLFVSGIRDAHHENDLANYFSAYGTVVNVEIGRDRLTGQRKEFAFITFDDNVTSCAVNVSHMINGVSVYVKKCFENHRGNQADRERRFRSERIGRPGYGQPIYAPQEYRLLPYGYPAYGLPTYGLPAYGQPAYVQPAYGQQPAHGQPAYGQPTRGPLAYHGESVYERPGQS